MTDRRTKAELLIVIGTLQELGKLAEKRIAAKGAAILRLTESLERAEAEVRRLVTVTRAAEEAVLWQAQAMAALGSSFTASPLADLPRSGDLQSPEPSLLRQG